MASPSGTSSGSSLLHGSGSGSDEDPQAAMERKRRRRMMSNRESAKRSRVRKQKHLDDLEAQVSRLRKENSHVFSVLSLSAQHCSAVEAENRVLRAQAMELSRTLQCLNEISSRFLLHCEGSQLTESFITPWKLTWMINQPPFMDSAENVLFY